MNVNDALLDTLRPLAQERLRMLTIEQEALVKFLDNGHMPSQRRVTKPAASEAETPRKRKRKPMSAAARKAMGKRMKAYWAERRAAAK